MSLEWHSRGQGFDSPWLHQKTTTELLAMYQGLEK
jgi:hypothetical protein